MIVKNIAYIDTETTGLDPKENELIELFIVYYTEDGTRKEKGYKFKFDEKKADQKALRINRFYERKSEWIGSETFPYYSEEIYNILKGKDIVGHNISFDARFLEESFRNVAYVRVPWKRTVDTYSIARFVLPNLKKHSMDTLRDYFRINPKNNHTAKQDVMDMISILNLMKSISDNFIFRIYCYIRWRFFN